MTDSAMLDEDVLDWLDSFKPHDIRNIIGTLNMIIGAHRAEIKIGTFVNSVEDVSAITHDDLAVMFRLANPVFPVDTATLSNVDLLGLTLSAKGLIDYQLPERNSPILAARTYKNKMARLLGRSTRFEFLLSAFNRWQIGEQDITINSDDFDDQPKDPGLHLALDEHMQVRYGAVTFIRETIIFTESRSDGTTIWSTDDEDGLPLSLLRSFVPLITHYSPDTRALDLNPQIVSDHQRIFLLLRSLSPHVKAEIVAHFDGLLSGITPTSVESIGRWPDAKWHQAAHNVADNAQMFAGKTSWSEHSAWDCFVATMNSLQFNFKTRQFDAQCSYKMEI